jgi:hypothetical protein
MISQATEIRNFQLTSATRIKHGKVERRRIIPPCSETPHTPAGTFVYLRS